MNSLYNENNNIDFYKETKYYNNSQINEPDISLLEQELNLKFPDSYKVFLYETNGGEFNTYQIPEDYGKNPSDVLNYYYPKLNEQYDKSCNKIYMYRIFSLIEILDYWDILKSDDIYTYQSNIINEEYKLIPIGLDGNTGIFYIGSKGSQNEGKIYFYDYGDSSQEGDDPSTSIGFICDSFEEYINSFYYFVDD